MKRLTDRRINSFSEAENVNPMEGVANLADVMLLLAVGIMMALVIHWNVDIGMTAYVGNGSQDADPGNTLVLDIDNFEDIGSAAGQLDSNEMEKLGTVYFDEETQSYYIIVD